MSPGSAAPAVARLSIIITAWTSPDALRRCLDSLCPQIDTAFDEIVVARNFPVAIGSSAARPNEPRILDLECLDATVPRLRAHGLAAATGDLVAFVEDHCTCTSGWCAAIIAAYTPAIAGVGGPVDLGEGGQPLDWAVYFYDYARFAPPLTSGRVNSLSGANMSWQRSFLVQTDGAKREEVLEPALEHASRQQRLGIWLAAGAVVVHHKRNTATSAITLAFALARGYASARFEPGQRLRRTGHAAATVLLPAVLMGRIVGAVLRSGRHRLRLLASLPWLIVLVVSWSVGEASGYLAGAGMSRTQWK